MSSFAEDWYQMIETSTIQLLTHEVFMHHAAANLPMEPKQPNDQHWLNQAVYFWRESEPWERKSLPPEFEHMDRHFFIVQGMSAGVSVQGMTAIPWFGMPGLGDKLCFTQEAKPLSLPLMAEQNVILYIEFPELQERHLRDRERCFWLMDASRLSFDGKSFSAGEKPIVMGAAVEQGLMRLIRLRGVPGQPR